MSWAKETAKALVNAFDGAFDPDVVVAAAAIEGAANECSQTERALPDSRFEIGSITKTMTATVVAMMVESGEVGLEDPVGRWLEAGDNGSITIAELTTHTSGLPRLAPNQDVASVDRANPYATFTAARAEESLRQAEREGRSYRYSNFGYQLLGLVVERVADEPLAVVVRRRLFEPLSMNASGIGADGAGTRLTGHARGKPVPHWDQPLAGAGGVEATIEDLARYTAACLSPPAGPLGEAIRLTQARVVVVDEHLEAGMGWLFRDRRFLWHNGGTGGFSSSVVIDASAGRAVVVLASAGGVVDAIDAGALLAINGRDPRTARPEAPGEEWKERAIGIVRCLLEDRPGEVHSQLTAPFQAELDAKRLRRVWRLSTLGAGRPGAVEVECRRIAGAVAADVNVAFSRRPVRLSIVFTPSGEVSGLIVLRAGEDPPW